MITRITGKLVQLGSDHVILEIGAFEYEVFVPEVVRRQLQTQIGNEVSLHTLEYLDGNPQQGRLTPRLIGFLSSVEREFFEAICQVDGVGVKKALRSIVRPVRDVATAIEEQNVKELSALPGIGPSLAERIVAKLRRKMAKFALMIAQQLPAEGPEQTVVEETYQALIAVGHSPTDARQLLEDTLATKKKFKSVEELLQDIYLRQRN